MIGSQDRVCVTHLPSGATAVIERDRCRTWARVRREAVRLAVSKAAAMRVGPPRLVRDYDLTGPEAGRVTRILDGDLGYGP